MEGEKKKERPQNKNLKPFGSGLRTPEEELEIQRKGKEAATKARRRNADMRAAVRAIANLNATGKKTSKEITTLKSVDQLQADGAPLISQVVYAQFQCALEGDKESRDWICKMLGVDTSRQEEASTGLTVTAETDALEAAGGVRIHLIRGDRPQEPVSAEDEATRAAARLAMVEAMKAIGEDGEQNTNAAQAEVSPDG